MKVLLIGFLAMSICLGATATQAAEVTLKWEQGGDQVPSGFAIFERNQTSGQYDYANPIWPTDESDHKENQITFNVSNDFEHAFVCRAYLKTTKLDGSQEITWSNDSNEVTFLPKVEVDTPKNLILSAVQYLSQAIDNLMAAVKKME